MVEVRRELSLAIYQAKYYKHLTKPVFLEVEEEKVDFGEVYRRLKEILMTKR
ncbi:hypothetical protein [Sulfolobus acidocaldarius]|uniref:Uncharacterized protein n=3 Tax=Sulfolobus acidocaldarius TaxID=2285 RepID=M1JB24_9CREN|nr:hypothetical protein [Sulfolobus acidocaldarius]AGE70672.1 hypothetical protein SacN8_03495 [Sulfolobus acidocaldarius N8]AGE72945.1 hypothetical protein SacRon12I_03485 [Sulfolobus acidocaldarius Ron12/I]